MKKIFSFLVLTLLICSLAGCVYTPPVDGAINGVVITSVENDRNIKVDETLQLTATVYPLTAAQTVTWSSSNNSVAVVDEAGVVTAISRGRVEIYAVSTVDSNAKQSFALIVEALTDNKNRTASDVRHAFDKFGGSLGSNGCVSYLFNRKGVI